MKLSGRYSEQKQLKHIELLDVVQYCHNSLFGGVIINCFNSNPRKFFFFALCLCHSTKWSEATHQHSMIKSFVRWFCSNKFRRSINFHARSIKLQTWWCAIEIVIAVRCFFVYTFSLTQFSMLIQSLSQMIINDFKSTLVWIVLLKLPKEGYIDFEADVEIYDPLYLESSRCHHTFYQCMNFHHDQWKQLNVIIKTLCGH